MHAHGLIGWLLSGAVAHPQAGDAWAPYYSDRAPVEAFAPIACCCWTAATVLPWGLSGAGKRLLAHVR